MFQQNLENQHHNKIIVYKTFFQQYLLSNQLQQARNMLYGNKYQENPQNFFHDHNTLLFVMNLNNIHWNLLYLNISAKACYIIDSKNSIKSEVAYRIISFLCTINIIDNHNIDYLSINNWKTHNLSSPQFPEQNDTNNCGVFALMNIYQILKYGTIKELFSANDVKTFRDYIFDMILHTHFEKYEGMMNNIINNDVLLYTMDEDEIAKVREELKNTDNNDDEKQIKRKEAKQKRDLKKELFEKSFTKKVDIESFI